jgi:fatty acid-binding protein DegV
MPNENHDGKEGRVEKLTYNARETCQALGISPTTLWRLEKRGRITAISGLRTKLFSVRALRKFADEGVAA